MPVVQPRDAPWNTFTYQGRTFSSSVLGAISSSTLLVYAWEDELFDLYGYYEVKNLNSTAESYDPSTGVRCIDYAEFNGITEFKQSNQGLVCWFTITTEDIYINTYRDTYIETHALTGSDGTVSLVEVQRVTSTGEFAHFIYSDSTDPSGMLRIGCCSLTSGVIVWNHIFQDPYPTEEYRWDEPYVGWRTGYEFVAAASENRYIVHNTSPDTVFVSAEVTQPTDYDASVDVGIYLNETGETRVGNPTVSLPNPNSYWGSAAGGGLYTATSYTQDGEGFWIEPTPRPSGFLKINGTTVSTDVQLGAQDSYYDVLNTYFYVVTYEGEITNSSTGSFTLTLESDDYVGCWEGDGFGYGYAPVHLYYYVMWDNSDYGGGNLELRDETGDVLDTLTLPQDRNVSYIPYASNKIFCGSTCRNPWTGDYAESKLFWRIITVSGDTMSYGPIHTYDLPSHFTWDNIDYYYPEYSTEKTPCRWVTLGVWDGQVIVHPVGFTGGCCEL